MIQIGLEVFLAMEDEVYPKSRIGYLSNQASTTRSLVQGRIPLQEKFGERLTCLFSPQHGFFSEKQDNMVESDHALDKITGLPVFSLYGEHRRPTEDMFARLDLLLIDLVDVGTRVYTYMYTMAYCLEAAAEFGKKIVILDRPNPIGGEKSEGNILSSDCASFVGLYPLPMRHGLTLGELALLMNNEYNIGADLEVVSVKGWRRNQLFRDIDFPWVAPSPNMPSPETTLVYPGQVLWEGTEISEGRGTTQPFEFVGAPYWQHKKILSELGDVPLPGCSLRPIFFEPTSGKYADTTCCGFQLHVTDRNLFMPYRTTLALLQVILQSYPESFEYKKPPYEYEYKRLPMDLLIGDTRIRTLLEGGEPILEIEKSWQQELAEFDLMRAKYYLY
jgi:uncharacterized protein YbbC (DUF1343 family)